MTKLLQFLCNNVSINRTIELTCSTYLSSDAQGNTLDSLTLLLCLCLDGGELMSLLFEVLCENLLSRRRSNNALALRNQIYLLSV